MNDNTYKLLDELAKKLNTTAEYLWDMLLKQAPISATIDLLFFVLMIVINIILVKVHLYLSKERELPDWHRKQSIYEDKSEVVAIPMIIISLVCVVLLLISFSCLENVINGFLHPEYWALDRIMSIGK